MIWMLLHCQKYVLLSKVIPGDIIRGPRELDITLRECENLTAFEPEVTIPYGFACHDRTKRQLFRISERIEQDLTSRHEIGQVKS
jgi:hypothetical protein